MRRRALLREIGLGSIPQPRNPFVDDVDAAYAEHQDDPNKPPPRIGGFDIVERIGAGGFGVVYLGRDLVLDRYVAIKLCRAPGELASEALLREARMLAKLDHHPNIVAVYDFGVHDDNVFLVMQHVDGEDACAFVQRSPTWEQIVDVYRNVGRGLAAAHESGIVHGDIKPSNILCDRKGFARLADFGLGQILFEYASPHEREALRRRAGTLGYMAPEVLRGGAPTASSDQFSFCVALWQSLDGELPYPGRSTAKVLRQIERRKVRIRNRSVPAELRAILKRGLSCDPAERYPSMSALVDALDRVRVPVSAVELRPIGGERASRAKRGAFLSGFLLVGLVCVALGWVGRGRVERPRPSEELEEGVSMEIDPVVLAVCTYIRRGQIEEAEKTWESVYRSRWADIESLTAIDPAGAADKLGADTMIIVDAFREWARLSVGPDVDKANKFAREWTPFAEQAWAEAKKIREQTSGRTEQPAPK